MLLKGLIVNVQFIETWDFVTQYGSSEYRAQIEDTFDDLLLLRFPDIFRYKGEEFDQLVANYRHETSSDSILLGNRVSVDLTPVISNVRLQSAHFGQLSVPDHSAYHYAGSWRSWGLLATIQKI